MTKKFSGILVLATLLVFATTAQAVLFRVGPNDVPSPPGNGFPFWYQDTQGLALDLCIPRNQAQLDAGVCLIFPRAVDPVAGIDLPIVFPTNFPDEAFWWNATAVMNLPGGNGAVLVLGLEAAFGGGAVAVGDQVTFGRLRIVVDAPVAGNYTVTTPYAVKVFPGVEPGKRAITFTSDIGIGAPGDFTGALKSEVGPFLRAADAPGGNLLPLVRILNDTTGDQFLSDAAVPVFVTGSPIDDPDDVTLPIQKANFFRVCVDAAGGLDGSGTACVTVDQFTLMGKVHTAAIGSPLVVDRATYKRSGTSAQVDVFATASPGPGAPTPVLSFGDSAGTDLMPSALMHGPTTLLDQYYGQSIPTLATAIPAGVIVTNVADNPPSSVTQSLVDEVTITQADFSPGLTTNNLTITAASRDELNPPQLFVVGLPGSATGSDELTGVVGNAKTGTFTIPPVAGGPVPPATVTVISSKGGQDTEAVTTTAGGTFAPGAPVAVDDSALVQAGTVSLVPINVIANDSPDRVPNTVRIVSQGQNGTAVADTTGVVTYTFLNPNFVGDDFFSYTVKNAAGLESNVAFVLVTTFGQQGAPIAVNDGPLVAQVNAPLVIPATFLTANDQAGVTPIILTSIQIVAGSVTPAGATATVAPTTGDVTYTSPLAGSFGFSYTVANGSGTSNAAFVSINVTAPDVISNLTARFRTGNRRWDVSGTCLIPGPGNTVRLDLVQNGVVLANLATNVPVDAAGAWAFRAQSSPIVAGVGDEVRATSTAGGSATVLVNVTK